MMRIIPAINCENRECVENRFTALRAIALESEWGKQPVVHVDISDGIATPVRTVEDPATVIAARDRLMPHATVSAHCMTDKAFHVAQKWLSAGALEVFIHLNAETQTAVPWSDTRYVPVLIPETDYRSAAQFLAERQVKKAVVLSVIPGRAGQEFQRDALAVVRFLRKHLGNATIGVDGGMNAKTVQEIREAGADIAYSASAIFSAADPVQAFRELEQAGA